MTKLRVLHLLGLDDTNQVRVTHLSPDPRRLQYECLGNVELSALLDTERFDVITFVAGKVPSDALRVQGLAVVVNAICDADTNTSSLEVAAAIVERLGDSVGVVNHPRAVLSTTRDRVSERLAGLPGAIVPKTVRVSPRRAGDVLTAGVAPPFLVREAGTHGGHRLVLVRGDDDACDLEQFAFDGRAYYLTEFVDFRSADGLYRKYRTLVIDGVPHAKHLIVSEDWNVHARSRPFMAEHPELLAEEAAFVESMPDGARRTFASVHERLGLDYLGADFGLTSEGEVVIFEVNCCFRPLVGTSSASDIESHHASTARIKAAFADLITSRAF